MSGRSADLMRALHEQHAPALWSFSLRLTNGDRGRAEDVVQETLLRAWKRPEILNPESDQDADTVRGWLFTVARNVVIDQWRSTQRRPESVLPTWSEPAQADAVDRSLQSMLVAQALQQLTPEHRVVLLECYFRGCTAAQAAQRLAVPIGTVKSRLHYALRALRLSLQEMGVVS